MKTKHQPPSPKGHLQETSSISLFTVRGVVSCPRSFVVLIRRTSNFISCRSKMSKHSGCVYRNYTVKLFTNLGTYPFTRRKSLQTVSETKREEFIDDALIYAKSLCEELEISSEPPRRIRRKHLFGDGSIYDQLSYKDDLRRTMFSSIDRVTAEIRE
ncbi:uncharacterized protein TNCV_1514241 [Trichonephila clavipes]|nr:uncharacterized protein TNCV_1514241 [Trichonephila clavipes]